MCIPYSLMQRSLFYERVEVLDLVKELSSAITVSTGLQMMYSIVIFK